MSLYFESKIGEREATFPPFFFLLKYKKIKSNVDIESTASWMFEQQK